MRPIELPNSKENQFQLLLKHMPLLQPKLLATICQFNQHLLQFNNNKET